MKKIGILNFHFCDNYGAVLQCYALKYTINKLDGCYAEVINFNPNWKPSSFENEIIKNKYISKLDKYEKFREKYLEIESDFIYDMTSDKCPKFDYYIVGSDQVWNTTFSFSNTAYFLDFVEDNSVKISYAASIGIGLEDKRLNPKIFEKYIPNFNYLSIREKTHEAFVQQFTEKKVHTVLDPTLLLEKEEYDKLIDNTKSEKEKDKYIFFYFLNHDKTAPLAISFVNMLARKYNLKVIHFFTEAPKGLFKNNSDSFFFDGPIDFLWYIKNAEIIVTNSFHGTIFSILYQKPFYTYIVKSMSSRIYDLLENLGLKNRIISGFKKLRDVDFNIDYTEVNKKIKFSREYSLNFLKKSLNIKKF
ncbi:polysaccharide pyruvyl transferase family protein [Sedimentibacter sp. MB31-C6]|uniref:polysaccharide pyruvyl transferase family protein n=1 Tax=Sedimentibacter sp. MB31-C6 TaxID=3109366 RepID=UPI002DDCB5E5|nr:polysaccharide pyruvyl transferase family protein [Sedimentibacter sp. MB36-C1]WSI04965.1 polysaccharide pyruvyl transferase family protein [Sedimentibacter sp. MB36-C1]